MRLKPTKDEAGAQKMNIGLGHDQKEEMQFNKQQLNNQLTDALADQLVQGERQYLNQRNFRKNSYMFDGHIKSEKNDQSMEALPDFIEASQLIQQNSNCQLQNANEGSQAIPLNKLPSSEERRRLQRLQMLESGGSPGQPLKFDSFERDHFRQPREVPRDQSQQSYGHRGGNSDKLSDSSEHLRQ